MRKNPVLLLELVISLALFGAMIGFLFSSYREFSITKTTLSKEKELILNRQKLQLRLSQIFSHLNTLKMEGSDCLLTYDNGIDIEPDFRGPLEALLLIDKGRLALVTWSKKGQGRKEILFESARSFKFDFFDPKTGNWTPLYPEQKPVMMKIFVDGTPYPFFL